MESELKTMNENLAKLVDDVAILKEVILSKNDEGELSDWAKQELEEARKEPDGDLISLEDLRKEIENGL